MWADVGNSVARVGLTPSQASCGLDGLCTLYQAVPQMALSRCSLPCSCLFQDNNLSLIMEQKTRGVGEQTQCGVLAEGWGPAWLLVMRPTPWDAVIELCSEPQRTWAPGTFICKGNALLKAYSPPCLLL